jgi:hypothetical protein
MVVAVAAAAAVVVVVVAAVFFLPLKWGGSAKYPSVDACLR